MSHSNVVPFDPARRGGLDRRGSPDKTGDACGELVAMDCPSCGCALRVSAGWLEDLDAVLCGRCDAEIALVPACRERGAG